MANVERTTRLESFKEKIRRAFMAYVTHASTVLTRQEHSNDPVVPAPIRLVNRDSRFTLRHLTAQAENSLQFQGLRAALDLPEKEKATEPARPSDIPTFDDRVSRIKEMTPDDWQNLADFVRYFEAANHLSDFFKRSCFYLNAFNGKTQSLDELFDILWSRLRGEYHAQTTNLSILDEVAFANRCLDFGTFKIQKFSKAELDDLTGQTVNKIFYPLAQLDDTDFLSRYWFLVEGPSRWSDEKMADVDDDERDKIEQWRQIKLQMPQTSIQLLALYNWEREFTEDALIEVRETSEAYRESLGWTGFVIRKTLTVSTDLFSAPSPLPNVTRGSNLLAGFEMLFSEEHESEIKALVSVGQRLLQIVQAVKPRWEFVENAMGYLGKAFVATPNLEQLLWNTIAIECLLSEKKDDTVPTNSMRYRIGMVLGETEEERTRIRKEFGEVYSFRCELVHSNRFDSKTQFRHLAQARNLARRVMSRFVYYLLKLDTDYQEKGIEYKKYPSRERLLDFMDNNESWLKECNREISKLSARFPRF